MAINTIVFIIVVIVAIIMLVLAVISYIALQRCIGDSVKNVCPVLRTAAEGNCICETSNCPCEAP